jgi:hypothetical protein
MAISINSVRRGAVLKPTIDLVYAPQGMGKTTYAAGSPDPIFIQTEDGLGVLDVPTFGLLKTYDDVLAAITALATEEHDYKTAVFDSAGWLEPLVWDKTCKDNGWANIEAAGYGKGPIAAANYWRVLLDGASYLRDNRGMGVIILAHSEVKKQEPPDGEDYDRYQPKLHARATAMLQEYADDVFFINTRVSITRSAPQDKNSRGIAVGSNQRFLYTSLKATHMAKNRFSMPEMIPLPNPPAGQTPDPFTLFSTVARHIPYYKAMLEGDLPKPEGVEPFPVEVAPVGAVVNPFANLGEAEIETEPKTENAEANNNLETV